MWILLYSPGYHPCSALGFTKAEPREGDNLGRNVWTMPDAPPTCVPPRDIALCCGAGARACRAGRRCRSVVRGVYFILFTSLLFEHAAESHRREARPRTHTGSGSGGGGDRPPRRQLSRIGVGRGGGGGGRYYVLVLLLVLSAATSTIIGRYLLADTY